jgi:hypothetical protein
MTSQWQGSGQDIPTELHIEYSVAWTPSRIVVWEEFLQDNLPVPVRLLVKTEGQSLACGCKIASEASETPVEHSSTCTCACNFCSKQRYCACTKSTCVCGVLCNCSCPKCKHVVVSHCSNPRTEGSMSTNESFRTPTLHRRYKSLHSPRWLRRGSLLRQDLLRRDLRRRDLLLREAPLGRRPHPPPPRLRPPLQDCRLRRESLRRRSLRLLDPLLRGVPRGRLPQLPPPQLQIHRRPQQQLLLRSGQLHSPGLHCQLSWVRRFQPEPVLKMVVIGRPLPGWTNVRTARRKSVWIGRPS